MKPTWAEIRRQIQEAEYRAWLASLKTPPWVAVASAYRKDSE